MPIRLISVLLILTSINLQASEVIRLANGEWLPFLSENLKHYGIGSHIVTKAFRREGVVVEYHFLPWKRNFDTTKHGVYDGSVLWANVLDREDYFIFSNGIIPSENAYFHLKTSPFSLKQPQGVSHIRAGVISGYAFPNIHNFGSIEAVGNEIQNIQKLIRGRIDVYVTDKIVGYYMLNRHFPVHIVNSISHYEEVIRDGYYDLVLNRNLHQGTNLMERFNRGLKALKDSGEYDRLLRDFEQGKYELD